MEKTKEELNALKDEIETLNKKIAELTEEELAQVAGGAFASRIRPPKIEILTICNNCGYILMRDPSTFIRMKWRCPSCNYTGYARRERVEIER